MTTVLRAADLLRPTPHPRLAWLRAHEPVWWSAELSAWVVTRHADVVSISTRPEVWSSASIAEVEDLTHPEFEGMGRESTVDLLRLDPPRHRAVRRPLARSMTPSRIAAWERTIDSGVGAAFDVLAAKPGGFEMFDLQRDLFAHVARRALLPILGPVADVPLKAGNTAELRRRLGEVLAAHQRRAVTSGCPVDVATHLADPGHFDDLTLEEASGLLAVSLGASDGTLRALLCGIVFVAQADPSVLDICRDRPELTGPVLEEVIRWWTPVRAMARTAVGLQRLGNVDVADGQPVVLLYTSANRDELVYGNDADEFVPERFVPERFATGARPVPHVGFGIGEHYCVGASVARRVAASFLRELAARAAAVRFSGSIGMYPVVTLSNYDAMAMIVPRSC